MPKKFYEVPPSKPDKDKIVIKLPKITKIQTPKELWERARHRKAGPMEGGRTKPKEGPLKIEEEAAANEEETLPKQKEERILKMIEEFNQWSRNEYLLFFEGLDLHSKSEKLKEFIKKEIKDPGNKESFELLELWLKAIEQLKL